ncbi:hypothetical protein D9M73_161510 [compost metagenome]
MVAAQLLDEAGEQAIGIHHPEHQQLEQQEGNQPAPAPDRRDAPHRYALHRPHHQQHAGDHDKKPGGQDGPQQPGREGAAFAMLAPEARDRNDRAVVLVVGRYDRQGALADLGDIAGRQRENHLEQPMPRMVQPFAVGQFLAPLVEQREISTQPYPVDGAHAAQVVGGNDLAAADAQVAPAPEQRRNGDQPRQQAQRHRWPGADALEQEHRFTQPVVGQAAANLIGPEQRQNEKHQRHHDVPRRGVEQAAVAGRDMPCGRRALRGTANELRANDAQQHQDEGDPHEFHPPIQGAEQDG